MLDVNKLSGPAGSVIMSLHKLVDHWPTKLILENRHRFHDKAVIWFHGRNICSRVKHLTTAILAVKQGEIMD